MVERLMKWVVILMGMMASGMAAMASEKDTGYRGVWYSINHGEAVAYSGGLGTYPPHIRPLAVYAGAVKKTFFVWGGCSAENPTKLRIMASYYDHAKGVVPRPTLVRDCGNFSDAHANPSLCIDTKGYLWVFAAQRGKFLGKVYRSKKAYDTGAFEEVGECNAYPQPWSMGDGGMFLVYTKYTGGRETYWRTKSEGADWSKEQQLTVEGHYVSSFAHAGKILVASDWHNGGSDYRTNLYFMQTADMGKTWTSVDGKVLQTPLRFPDNPALVRDYHAEKRYVFLDDVKVDRAGRPLILYVTSASGAFGPGKQGDPREWTLARWDGKEWKYSKICNVDHNYDYGNLRVEADGTLTAIGATEAGPQVGWCGGEISIWTSKDEGSTWTRERQLTDKSERNQTFPRIPLEAQDDFFAFWADGNPEKESESRLYFTTRAGKVFRLPAKMEGEFAAPEAAGGR